MERVKIKTMSPWKLDGYRTFEDDSIEDHLLFNAPIKSFLESPECFFLVGAKGLGKTVFLRYKSYLYHKEYRESIKFNQNNSELTENLRITSTSIGQKELRKFQDKAVWQGIWELALWTMAFRMFDLEINPELEKIVYKNKNLSSIITLLLNDRSKYQEYMTYLLEYQERVGEIPSGLMIFIDDFDQTLDDFLGISIDFGKPYNAKDNDAKYAWVYAQVGLVGAIYNINRQCSHIKIYATVRREAFEALDKNPMKINYKNHSSILEYNKDEIKLIFEKNIQIVVPSEYISPESKSWVGKFLGFDEMGHRIAKTTDGKPLKEGAFDYIYRHTYGRPREIVLIGKRLNELILNETYRSATLEDKIEKVRILVNKESHALFLQYKTEIVPHLNENKLNEFIEKIRSNVIPKDELVRLDKDIIRTYYNIGLLGYVHTPHQGKTMKQVFNQPATYSYSELAPMPETLFLVVHSTVDGYLLNKHTFGNFYNEYNIIGHGYDFYPKINSYVQRIDHYIPITVSGNRMVARSEKSGNEVPLQNLYNKFFFFDDTPTNHEKLLNNWSTAKRILGIIGRICYCHRLEKKFQSDFYGQKRTEFWSDLSVLHVNRKYNSNIRTDYAPDDLDRFLDKLVGRFITLGCYLILDMRIEWIHQLLQGGHFEFKNRAEQSVHQNAFTYISRSFFINYLIKDEPRNPKNPDHIAQKQRIFNQLSEFEKKELRDFVETACGEVPYLDWVTDEEHKNWLANNCVQKLWRPE